MVSINRTQLGGTTAATATNPLKATNIQRNPEVRTAMAEMGAASQRGGASQSKFLPAAGQRFEAFAFNYHTGIPKEMNILSAPKDGMVKGTMVINPSGHDGYESAKKYAESNTYSVRITLPDGKRLEWNNIPRNNPNSTEWATAIDIQFPYQKGTTIIEAWPDKSAGVYGYVEGRQYRMHSADQPYDWQKAKRDALAEEQKNPPTEHRPSRRPFMD